jgi:hypothetical protein
MTDIIIKSIIEFRNDEASKFKCNIADDIIFKYNQLFLKYDCFSNKVMYNKDSKSKHYGTKHKENVRSRRIQKDKTINELIMRIINIINDSNYTKMFNSIRILSNHDNISIIVNEILVRTCNNAFYLKLFTRLIKDLTTISSYDNIIIGEIRNFIDNFIKLREYVYKKAVINSSNYDIFCDEQKHKNYILTKNNIIINLYNENLHFIDINEYILYFYEELSGKELDENHQSLLIQILIDCIKNLKNLDKDLINKLKCYFENYTTTNKKTEFMSNELLNIIIGSK